jgi:tetratricopeptide (TPR) repeat protein
MLAPIAYLGVLFAGVVLFFVTARFRMPAVPILVLFATYTCVELSRLAAARRWRPVAIGVAAAAALVLAANVRTGTMQAHFDADTYHNVAVFRQQQGRFSEARELYGAALSVDPHYLPAIQGWAMTSWRLGQLDEARRAFERALAISRDPLLLDAAASFFESSGERQRAESLRAERHRSTYR